MSGAKITEHVGRLTCPKCGTDANDGHLRYVETIECWRHVWGTTAGQVQIAGEYQTGEGYDEGRDPHFECGAPDASGFSCGHRWPVPEWMLPQIDWELEARTPAWARDRSRPDPEGECSDDHVCDDECRSNGCSARFL